MKKVWLFVVLMMLAAGCALAEDAALSFEAKTGSMNGGFDYTLVVKSKKAPESDLTINLACDGLQGSYQLVIPAGEKQAALTVKTPVLDKREQVVFSFAEGEGYTGKGQHKLTILQMPAVKFYSRMYFGTVGKQMTVRVQAGQASNIAKGNNVFQLRNHDGVVLAEKSWKNTKNDLLFVFTPTEELEGHQAMTVWLGDICVSSAEGYGTIMHPDRRIVRQVDTERKLAGIGIDCGFNGRRMPEMLEVLEKHNTNVTFFMTGYFVRNFTEEAKAAVAAGHEIGNHSNTHPKLTKVSLYEMMREIVYTAETMEEILGVSPRLFRPPYGDFNSKVTSVCRSEGMENIMWSMDTKDSVGQYDTEKSIKYGTTRAQLAPGKILLTHLDSLESYKIVDACLTYYEEQGYTVLPISALLYATGSELPHMPSTREALHFTDDYWPAWLAEHHIPVQ